MQADERRKNQNEGAMRGGAPIPMKMSRGQGGAGSQARNA